MLKLAPWLISIIPELVRAAIGVWRDHAAKRRAEAEARKLEAEQRKGTPHAPSPTPSPRQEPVDDHAGRPPPA